MPLAKWYWTDSMVGNFRGAFVIIYWGLLVMVITYSLFLNETVVKHCREMGVMVSLLLGQSKELWYLLI